MIFFVMKFMKLKSFMIVIAKYFRLKITSFFPNMTSTCDILFTVPVGFAGYSKDGWGRRGGIK